MCGVNGSRLPGFCLQMSFFPSGIVGFQRSHPAIRASIFSPWAARAPNDKFGSRKENAVSPINRTFLKRPKKFPDARHSEGKVYTKNLSVLGSRFGRWTLVGGFISGVLRFPSHAASGRYTNPNFSASTCSGNTLHKSTANCHAIATTAFFFAAGFGVGLFNTGAYFWNAVYPRCHRIIRHTISTTIARTRRFPLLLTLPALRLPMLLCSRGHDPV